MNKRKFISAVSPILLVLLPLTAAGQKRVSIAGTWRLDTDAIEKQMGSAGVGADEIKRATTRLKQRRFVYGQDGSYVEIRDGFPRRSKWRLLGEEENELRLELLRDGQTQTVTVTMDGTDRMTYVAPSKEGPSISYVRESDIQTVEEPKPLAIGSKAPAIVAEQWLNAREFKGEFKNGHIYLIDFWATWCAPCIKALPELSRLQGEFRDKASVILVSNETREVVEAFLKKEINEPHGTNSTFEDLVSSLSVGVDSDSSAVSDYLVALNQRQIPVSIIVGPSGELEWVGHVHASSREDVADVLDHVIAGSWDRKKFQDVFKRRQFVQKQLPQINELVRNGKGEEAIELIDKLLPQTDGSPINREYLESMKRRLATTESEGK